MIENFSIIEWIERLGSLGVTVGVLIYIVKHMKDAIKIQRDDFLNALKVIEDRHDSAIETHRNFFSDHMKNVSNDIKNICSEIQKVLGK